MKTDDHRADNLLLRLFPYTPRPGRTPLEDFCTEALAWCLRNCAAFQVAFLQALNLKYPAVGGVAVATQNSYDGEEDEGDAGRFDLLLQLGDDEMLVVIEAKVGSGFGADQLRKYRRELNRQRRRLGFKKGRLITLTERREKPKGADRHLAWPDLQQLLAKEREGDAPHPAAVRRQFASFLEEKGLGPMKLPPVSAMPLGTLVTGMKLLKSFEMILKSLRNDTKLARIIGRYTAKFEDGGDGVCWLGVYGNRDNFWIGYGFKQRGQKWQAFTLVERALRGNRERSFRKHGTIRAEFVPGERRTWLEIKKALKIWTDWDGNRIGAWFLSSAKTLLAAK